MDIDQRGDFRKLQESLNAFKDAKIQDPIKAEAFYDTNVIMSFARNLINNKGYHPRLKNNAAKTINAYQSRQDSRKIRAI